MPLQRVPINNFRGGLNTRDGPFDLQPNESPDLSNVTISNLVGQLQVRQGKTRFDDGSMVSQADNMQQVVLGTTIRQIMLSIDGSIYQSNVGGTLTKLFTGTPSTIWAFAQYPDRLGNDKVWAQNGVDTPQSWDGTSPTTSNWLAATSGPLPNGTQLKVYGNRLWIIGVQATAQRVFFSPFGDPEAAFQAYGFIDLRGPEDELDAFQDLEVLGTRLYLFKRQSVWVINDPSTLANRRLGSPGVASRFQISEMNDKLYWFNGQGLWSTGGVSIAYESGSIQNWFQQNLNYQAITTARLISTRDAYQRLFLAVPTNSSLTPNILIESVPNINFRRIGGRRYLLLPAYFLHTIPTQSLAQVNLLGTGQWQTLASDSTTPKLYLIFQGQTDDGAQIQAHWKSAWMAIQGEEPFERIRRVNVELLGDAVVDIFKDFATTPDFSETLPNPSESGLDVTWNNPPNVWDNPPDQWDPPNQYRFARIRPESRGRFHQIQFRTLTSPSATPFFINVAEFAIRGGKEH